MAKPNLFIIGKPKSGTTSLHMLLSQHPEVFMCSPKEPGFFSEDIRNSIYKYTKQQGTQDFHKKIFQYNNEEVYLSLFSNVKNEKIIGEGTTNYIHSRVAAKLIYKFNPDSKILVFFREPVDYLISAHSHNVRTNNEDVSDFRKAIELENKRKRGLELPRYVTFPERLFYLEKIKYADELSRFTDVFPSDNIKILLYENFQADNNAVYREILQFLGVDPDFVPEAVQLNKSFFRRFQKISFLNKKMRLSEKLKNSSELLYSFTKKAFDRISIKQSGTVLNVEYREHLQKSIKPEVIKLNDLLHKYKLVCDDINLTEFWGYE